MFYLFMPEVTDGCHNGSSDSKTLEYPSFLLSIYNIIRIIYFLHLYICKNTRSLQVNAFCFFLS